MKMNNKPWYPEYIRTKETKDFSLITFLKDFIFYHRVRYMVYFRLSQKLNSNHLNYFMNTNYTDFAENTELK